MRHHLDPSTLKCRFCGAPGMAIYQGKQVHPHFCYEEPKPASLPRQWTGKLVTVEK